MTVTLPQNWKSAAMVDTIYRVCFHPDVVKDLTVEERQKRVFVFIAAIITIPTCAVFGILHLANGSGWISGAADFITAGMIFLFSFVLIKSSRQKQLQITRALVLALSVQFLFYVGSGLYGGGEFFWLYTYPLISVFLFGFKEGMAWTFVFFAMIFFMIFGTTWTTISEFGTVYKLKLAISIGLTSFMAALFELIRNHYFQKLERQKHELENALKEIKTLSGMIPICSSCKKIRDDQGYWDRIESYIERHSDALFSHSICPKCTKELYGSESWYSAIGDE